MSVHNHKSKSPVRDLIDSMIVGIVLTGISYLVGSVFGWIKLADINLLEVFAVFTSYSCTYLCVVQRRINYPIGAISSAGYAILFIRSGLFASALLNAYLVPSLIYGWIRWRKDEVTRPVKHVKLSWVPMYLLVTGLGYGGAALISGKLGGSMAWADSVILAGSILAQFLLDNKKLENWIVWAVVNVFAIYTYLNIGLVLVAFQYVFFLLNTVYGFVMWKRSMDYEKVIRAIDGDAANKRPFAVDSIR
jgi:nicotinamide mononucleotide transporter